MPQRRSTDTLTVQLHGAHGAVAIERHEPLERRRPARRFAPSRPIEAITEAPSRGSVSARERLYRRALSATDALAAGVAVLVAAEVLGDDRVTLATLLVAPIVVLIHKIAGLYEHDDLVLRRSTLDEMPVLFQLAGLFALLVFLLGDSIIGGELDPEQVVGLWALVFAASTGGRMLARGAVSAWAQTERCLVIGSPGTAEHIRRKMHDSNVNADVVATLPLSEGHDLALGDGTREFRAIVDYLGIDRVILAPVSTDSADMLELIRIAKAVGVRVSLLPRMLEVIGTSVEFDNLDGLAMLGVRRFGLTRSSRAIKRAFDVVVTAIGLVAVSPLLAALALAVRLESPGPIFFRQTRVGRDGERFEMIKFRSMVADAESLKADLVAQNEAVGLFKIANDPRITPVGRFIRRTSLDELPQLFNVMRGEMSLVGPRPLVIDEDEKVEGLLRSRLHLTPGMTGPWQVLGSARIPMPEMVKIDYLYVASWSLWSDIKLLLRTVPHIFARGGM